MKKEESRNRMETRAMGPLVWFMALPMMVSLLVQSLYNIVDSVFVARLGQDALTAASLACPVQMLMIAAGVGTAVGINSILSRTLGMKNYGEASRIAQTGLVLSAAWALFFAAAGLAFVGRLTDIFTDDPRISAQCASYLRICMVFCLGNLVCMAFRRLLQASGRAGLSMAILVSGALTNLILDPVMIFGLFGYPAMEVRGAAWATVIGQWVSMFAGLILNMKMNPDLDLAMPGFRMEKARIMKIYQVGLPTMIMQAMTSLMVTAFNAILLPFSSAAVAFFGVYYKLQNFLFMPMNGLGQAAIPIIGYNYGARRPDRILEAGKILYLSSCAVSLAGTLIFHLSGGTLLCLFSAGEAMLNLGIPALKIISLTFVPATVTMITGYFASGLGDGMTNMTAAFLRQFVPLIPCAFLLARYGGIGQVWYAFWISEAAGLILALCRLGRMKKRIKGKL